MTRNFDHRNSANRMKLLPLQNIAVPRCYRRTNSDWPVVVCKGMDDLRCLVGASFEFVFHQCNRRFNACVACPLSQKKDKPSRKIVHILNVFLFGEFVVHDHVMREIIAVDVTSLSNAVKSSSPRAWYLKLRGASSLSDA